MGELSIKSRGGGEWYLAKVEAMTEQTLSIYSSKLQQRGSLLQSRLIKDSTALQITDLYRDPFVYVSGQEHGRVGIVVDRNVKVSYWEGVCIDPGIFHDCRFEDFTVDYCLVPNQRVEYSMYLHPFLLVNLVKLAVRMNRVGQLQGRFTTAPQAVQTFFEQAKANTSPSFWQEWYNYFLSQCYQLIPAYFYPTLSALIENNPLYYQRDIRNEDWVLHVWATAFDTAIVKVTNEAEEYYFPNTPSEVVPALYFVTEGSLLVALWTSVERVGMDGGVFLENCFGKVADLCNLYARNSDNSLDPVIDIRKREIHSIRAKLQQSVQLSRNSPLLAANFDPITTSILNSLSSPPSTVPAKCIYCEKPPRYTLPCMHQMCEHCTIEKLVIFEHAYCDIDSLYVLQENLTPSLSRNASIAVSLQRTMPECTKCRKLRILLNSPIQQYQDSVQQLECGDFLCISCREVAVWSKTSECPVCERVVDLHREDFDTGKVQCVSCKVTDSISALFTPVKCADHRSCRKCVSRLLHTEKCAHCSRDYSVEEQKEIERYRNWRCVKCDEILSAYDIWAKDKRTCECIVCESCIAIHLSATFNIRSCPGATKPCGYTESLSLTLYQLLEFQSEEEQLCEEFNEYLTALKSRKFYKCKICDDLIKIKQTIVCAGICGHVFHRKCLASFIRSTIRNIVDNEKSEMLKCPMRGCIHEIDSQHLTGALALVKQKHLDKYDEYAAMNILSIPFICSRCNVQNLIEPDDLGAHFHCPCDFDQCVECKGQWFDGHDKNACLFQTYENLIKTQFSICAKCDNKGCDQCVISQCPACKQPALKTPGCSHVTCNKPHCDTDFCFSCACLYLPTTVHGKAWHRPQCPDFIKDKSEAEIQALVAEQQMSDKCKECVRLGHLCPRPKNLTKPPRFALAEY